MSSDVQFKILVKIGDQVQSLVSDKNSFTVGRSKKADLQIEHEYLSNLHFRFDEVGKNKFTITDLGSTNGTFFKNKQLQPQTAVAYTAGDEILIRAGFGIRLKIIPQNIQLPNKLEINSINKEIEEKRKSLVEISELVKVNQATYLNDKKIRQEEMEIIEEQHRQNIKGLVSEVEKVVLAKMDESLKVVLIKEELLKLTSERYELKDIVETQYTALKLITNKVISLETRFNQTDMSLNKTLSDIETKNIEYVHLSNSLKSAHLEYDQLKHKTDLLKDETKKLVEIYQLEKIQFDSEMEIKRKAHMDELTSQLEKYNEEAISKRTDLDYLKTEFDLKYKAFNDNLKRYELKEKEKLELDLAKKNNQVQTEILYIEDGFKKLSENYELTVQRQKNQIEEIRLGLLNNVEQELASYRTEKIQKIDDETKEIEILKNEKNQMQEALNLIKIDLDKQKLAQKEFLEEMNRQRNEVISQAESETDKEIRTMKFKKVQELSEQISAHLTKDLMNRRGRALDDEYIEKSSVAIKRLIIEKMLDSGNVDTERTRQFVLGDEFKKSRDQSELKKVSSLSLAAGMAIVLSCLLLAALFFPEKILITKRSMMEIFESSNNRIPANNN